MFQHKGRFDVKVGDGGLKGWVVFVLLRGVISIRAQYSMAIIDDTAGPNSTLCIQPNA